MSNTHDHKRLSVGGHGLGLGMHHADPGATTPAKASSKAGIPAASPKSRERAEAAKAAKAAEAAKPSSSSSSSATLTSGELGGIEWNESEAKGVLYEFAKEQGLDVRSRDSKSEILKALSDATKAQG